MAANDFTNILPKILARGLLALREQAVMPRLVNIDYNGEAARPGTTIDVPLPVAQTAANVTAAPVYSSAAANTPALVQIPMSQWKMTDFYLTDKEMAEIDRNQHYIPMQTSEAVKALANAMDTRVHAMYKGVYGFVGTAGTAPFSTVATATEARRVLSTQLAPIDMRRIVIDPTAESQALQLAAFSNLEQTGDQAVKIEGTLGRKFGFDFYMSQNVQTHTTGTASALGVVVGSTTAVGISTLAIKAAASIVGDTTVVIGDVFTIAGDSQTYTVETSSTTLASALSNSDIRITPALKSIASSGAQITKKASHTVNLAFHRNAFAFVTRQLSEAVMAGNPTFQAQDPITGLALRIEVVRQHKQNSWQFDALYDAALLRPQFACRIAG